MPIEGQTIAILLNRIADVLDQRFGPHPTVPLDQLKPINAEVINASEFEDKDALLVAINDIAERAYKEAGLPLA